MKHYYIYNYQDFYKFMVDVHHKRYKILRIFQKSGKSNMVPKEYVIKVKDDLIYLKDNKSIYILSEEMFYRFIKNRRIEVC